MGSPTLLLGVDGATFRLLDPMMEEGRLPFLAELRSQGVSCELESTANPFTPAAWTSLATGSNPGCHGIFDFVRVAMGNGMPEYRMATSRDVRRETVWSIAGRQGCKAASLNFPVAFPPRPMNGITVPGFVPPRHLKRLVHPRSFYTRLSELDSFNPEELLMNLDLERTPIEDLPEERYEDWVRVHIRRETQWAEIAALCLDEGCELVGMIFDGADKLQHLCWRLLDAGAGLFSDDSWEWRVRELCLSYYEQLDEHLARLSSIAGPDATVIVCSDHGFGPTEQLFYVNALLANLGYVRWADGTATDENGMHMLEGHRNPATLFDWEQTRACALTAGSNGIYIRRGDGGVPDDQYESFRSRLAEELLEVRDPAGEPVVEAAIPREVAFPGPNSALAPDLTLVLRDHGFVSILRSERVLRARPSTVGTHHPHGVFMARGPGFRGGETVPGFGIECVGAMLLAGLELPIPEDLEPPPTEPYDEEWLAHHPIRFGPKTESPDPFFTDEESTLDPEGVDQLMDRLRALGYVE